MNTCVSLSRRGARLLVLACLSTPLLALASPAGDALARLQGETWVSRSFALSDLGFGEDVLLNGYDSRQEFYLPVPRTLRLADASIDFRGRYYKAEEGRTSMLLFVNGRPVHSRRIDTSEGDPSQVLKVDVTKPANGFLRFRVDWLNNVGQRICDVERSTGNVLAVSNDTRFNYRFSSAALTSLADAWLTLPARPTLLVASRSLNKTAYDTAWRLGVALEQANRRVQIRSFPAPGDTVDTTGWQLPPGLAHVPAFAALGQNNAQHALKDQAEVGALVVLGSTLATGDIVVADPALHKQVAAALDALAAQLAGDADAVRAFATWRGLQTAVGGTALPANGIRLATLGARPVIVVAEDAGAKAAGAFADVWRSALTTRDVVVAEANSPEVLDQASLRLTNLGGSDANFDVLARGDWTATLPLAAVAVNGRMPSDLVVDVAAAPGASSTRPVASVFWNNVLLSAKRLQADGHPERLDARVPGYALGLSNVVRVSFQRQPYSNDCNETPQAFPVNVLPTSYVRGGDSAPDGTFVGLLPLMSGAPQLIVPAAYLADAPASLMRVVRMAVAAGVTPVRAELVVAQDGATTPTRPFLAMQTAIDGAETRVVVKDAHLRINGKKTPWLDVNGLAQLSSIEVTRAHGQEGLYWQTLGGPAPAQEKPFVLNRGDIALIGAQGPVSWVDSSNPSASQPPRAGESAFYEWRRYLSWSVPLVSAGLLLLLLLLVWAYRIKRSRTRSKDL